MHRSISTVNADKGQQFYSATGRGIVWAVLDTGIEGTHPHFRKHKNLDLSPPLMHRDFTGAQPENPLKDPYGHGTHVAGIIAGEMTNDEGPIIAEVRSYTEYGELATEPLKIGAIAGMAPECKLLSMRVMDDDGFGDMSSVIAALAEIQQINGYGRRLLVHGVIIGLSANYEPERFACGLSPVCVEVERLVRSGVVVVVPAGNAGYALSNIKDSEVTETGNESSIPDPGNAEMAITVGSTHRELPRLYGVSYFSGKGPTVDGRQKPDLVAPGEKIVSCAAKGKKSSKKGSIPLYREDSGTTMSAAHVAGVIAGFLSVRRDYIGRPEVVKQIFMNTATDLQRTPSYQGKGLIDALRALQFDGTLVLQSSTLPYHGGLAAQDPGSLAAQLDRGERLTQAPSLPAPPPVVVPPAEKVKRPLRLMCSYSHKDEGLWDELKAHLASLRHQELIEIWYDRKITAGNEWKDEIDKNLEQAEIILLFVSAYFLDSEYCYSIEMKRAVERHDAGQAVVIPVIARPADWSGTPFGKIQGLPRDAKPATSWVDQHEAWQNVAQGIRKVVESKKSKEESN